MSERERARASERAREQESERERARERERECVCVNIGGDPQDIGDSLIFISYIRSNSITIGRYKPSIFNKLNLTYMHVSCSSYDMHVSSSSYDIHVGGGPQDISYTQQAGQKHDIGHR